MNDSIQQKYTDRQEAGRLLATELTSYADRQDTYVLALPRGGVPVAYEVAQHLHLPLDVLIVRKIGMPNHEEYAIGAIASPNISFLNEKVIEELGIEKHVIDNIIATERAELIRREKKYRHNKPFPNLENKKIILVDDGIATGATIKAAIQALRTQKPNAIIVAVPVAALDTVKDIQRIADKIVCPRIHKHFFAVGLHYDHFDQTTDEEVNQLLAASHQGNLT